MKPSSALIILGFMGAYFLVSPGYVTAHVEGGDCVIHEFTSDITLNTG